MAIDINGCLQETDIPSHSWMDDTSKHYPNQERLQQRKRNHKLMAHNLPTDNVENTIGTDKGENSLFAKKPRRRPRGTERMVQGD